MLRCSCGAAHTGNMQECAVCSYYLNGQEAECMCGFLRQAYWWCFATTRSQVAIVFIRRRPELVVPTVPDVRVSSDPRGLCACRAYTDLGLGSSLRCGCVRQAGKCTCCSCSQYTRRHLRLGTCSTAGRGHVRVKMPSLHAWIGQRTPEQAPSLIVVPAATLWSPGEIVDGTAAHKSWFKADLSFPELVGPMGTQREPAAPLKGRTTNCEGGGYVC